MKAKIIGQLGDYEIKQLKVFKAVVECGGFSAAEAQLNIARPTISVHIANLESRLSLTLCKRGRGGFALTEEGAVVYNQTCQLLSVLDDFRNTVNNLSASPAGQLRIALSDTFSTDERIRLDQIIANYRKLAPNVELHVTVERMVEMEQRVLNGELDVGFIPYHRCLDGLEYIHLFTDHCQLYCGHKHPFFQLAQRDISDEMLNQAALIHAGLQPHEAVFKQLKDMRLAAISYHYEARIAMILSGQYIAFLPEKIAEPYVQTKRLKVIAKKSKYYQLGAAVISRKGLSADRAKSLFLACVREEHPQDADAAPY